MYSYWMVGQLILNENWLKENGDDWRSFRVEVTCSEGCGFSEEEYHFLVDNDSAWEEFDSWLMFKNTENKLSLNELFEEFHNETGNKLIIMP